MFKRNKDLVFGGLIRASFLFFSFLHVFLLARFMTTENFGQFTFMLSFVLLARQFLRGGWPQLVVRETATSDYPNKNNKALSFSIKCNYYQFILVVFSFLSILYYVFKFDESAIIFYSFGAISIYFAVQIILFSASLRGRGKLKSGQFFELFLTPLLYSIFLVLIFNSRNSLGSLEAIFAFMTANIITFIAVYLSHKKLTLWVASSDEKKIPALEKKELIRSAFLIGIVVWASALYAQGPIIFLGYFSNNIEVANFRVAFQLSALISLGLTIINLNKAHAMSKAWKKGDVAEFQAIITSGCRFSFALAITLALPLIIFSEDILLIAFGEAYTAAADILIIMSLGQVINTFFGPVAVAMVAIREEHSMAPLNFMALSVLLLVSVFLIPDFGAIGAAFSCLSFLIIWNIALFIKVYKKCGVQCMPIQLFSNRSL